MMGSSLNSPANDLRQANLLQNNYHRPNFPWVCGNVAVGEPCWTGPTPDGKCGCRAECYPVTRQDGWACNRPLHRGGPCSDGPIADGQCCQQRPPCVPRRSLRSQRNRLSFALICCLLGLGLIIYGSGNTYDVIAPGPLSSPHAQRLAHQGNDRCASCHPQAHQSLGQWIGGLMGDKTAANHVSQTDLCLNCHQRDMCQEHALMAHNVAPQELVAISAKLTPNKSGSQAGLMRSVSSRLSMDKSFRNGQPLACATCHREHHGQQIDMKAMPDQQCQSCHVQTFHSFELDHPEFKSWPQVPAQGIRFDHSTHHFKHFPHGNRPFECSQCHRDDKHGNVQQLVPFQQACGDCHQGQIDLSSQGGLALLQLPSLDVETFRNANRDIGQWPAALSTDFDGRLTALSELLLMADREAAAGLAVLGHDFDFLDLEVEDLQQMEAATQVAWGLKRLLADLSERGSEAVRQRLQIVLGQRIDNTRLIGLTQNYSPTLFKDSARQWFPGLLQEVHPEQYSPVSDFASNAESLVARVEQELETRTKRLVLPPDILARLLPATLLDNDRSQELLSENPLAGLYGAAQTQDSKSLAGLPTTAETSATSKQPTSTARSSPSQQVDLTDQDDPNLLSRNPLSNYGMTAPADSSAFDTVTNQSPVSDAATLGVPLEDQVTTPPRVGQSAPVGPIVAAPAETPSRNSMLDTGRAGQPKLVGWVRDDAKFAIQYHVQGHADPWLKEWIELLVQQQGPSKSEALIAHVVDSIAAPDKAGNCLQCHGNRNGETSSASVSWTGQYRDPTLKGWTKFNHRPHTLLPGLSDCRSCHQLRETGPGQSSTDAALAQLSGNGMGGVQFARFSREKGSPEQAFGSNGDSHWQRHSDFHSITKSQCASCHQAGSTRHSCTTCHNYHIGQRVQK